MWWITGVPIWHDCFLLYLISLWRCFGSCVHKVFPHLSHSKTCQNRVCRTSASHWGWPCFWSTYLTSWSNGVPMRFDTILLNWSTLTVRSSTTFLTSSVFFGFSSFDLLDGLLFGFLMCAMVPHTVIWIRFQTTFSWMTLRTKLPSNEIEEGDTLLS